MKEKIKKALLQWATKVIENKVQWDEKYTYEFNYMKFH